MIFFGPVSRGGLRIYFKLSKLEFRILEEEDVMSLRFGQDLLKLAAITIGPAGIILAKSTLIAAAVAAAPVLISVAVGAAAVGAGVAVNKLVSDNKKKKR